MERVSILNVVVLLYFLSMVSMLFSYGSLE